jgi:hypothetical protein
VVYPFGVSVALQCGIDGFSPRQTPLLGFGLPVPVDGENRAVFVLLLLCPTPFVKDFLISRAKVFSSQGANLFDCQRIFASFQNVLIYGKVS